MCGRYQLNFDNSKLSKQIQNESLKLKEDFKEGEVFPGEKVLIIKPLANNKISLDVKKWGIKKKTTLINARIENINVAPTFKSIINNRCVIVASGFYEWHDKKKYYIKAKDMDFIYLAGLYNDNNECVIITREAYGETKHIHKRLPLILGQAEMLKYLFEGEFKASFKSLLITPTKVDTLL